MFEYPITKSEREKERMYSVASCCTSKPDDWKGAAGVPDQNGVPEGRESRITRRHQQGFIIHSRSQSIVNKQINCTIDCMESNAILWPTKAGIGLLILLEACSWRLLWGLLGSFIQFYCFISLSLFFSAQPLPASKDLDVRHRFFPHLMVLF